MSAVQMQFLYKCPKCGLTTISEKHDLEMCSVPVYKDGEPVILMPNDKKTYADFPKCGGDFTEWGPSVWWWQIPDDIQTEIIARVTDKEET